MATDAQKRARDKWKAKNKEKTKVINYRSTARNFIQNYSNLEDLEELKQLIIKRENELKK